MEEVGGRAAICGSIQLYADIFSVRAAKLCVFGFQVGGIRHDTKLSIASQTPQCFC
jgi:hypothetical protein